MNIVVDQVYMGIKGYKIIVTDVNKQESWVDYDFLSHPEWIAGGCSIDDFKHFYNEVSEYEKDKSKLNI